MTTLCDTIDVNTNDVNNINIIENINDGNSNTNNNINMNYYDYSKSTEEKYMIIPPPQSSSSSLFVGRFARERSEIDYTYHRYYKSERQLLHDHLIERFLQTIIRDANDDEIICDRPVNPWLVFTAGCMGNTTTTNTIINNNNNNNNNLI